MRIFRARAAVNCFSRLPHSHPGRAAAVGPRLIIRQGGSVFISQLTSMSRGRSTIRRLVDAGGSSYISAYETDLFRIQA